MLTADLTPSHVTHYFAAKPAQNASLLQSVMPCFWFLCLLACFNVQMQYTLLWPARC